MEKRNGGMVDMIEKEIYLVTEELLRLLNICNLYDFNYVTNLC